MANTITEEDARTCFGCDQNPPLFRLVSLERFPNESQQLEPDCMVGLFCKACLKVEIINYFAAFAQSSLPLGNGESTQRCLCRQIGFAVVPMVLCEEESALLAKEIEADWREAMVNWAGTKQSQKGAIELFQLDTRFPVPTVKLVDSVLNDLPLSRHNDESTRARTRIATSMSIASSQAA